ncbi:hypothetical protein D3C81_1992230 [compost metagenome]
MPIGLDDQRHMQVARLAQPQQFLQVELARGVIQQIGPAHDIGDALPGIVQYDRQLVGIQPVAAANHEIANFAPQMLFETPLDAIDEVIA